MATNRNPKIYYASVVAIFAFLTLGEICFLTHKEIRNDIAITKSLSAGITTAELYMQKNLQCATTALNLYIDAKGMPKNSKDLDYITEKTGVSNWMMYNSNGKIAFAYNGGWFNEWKEDPNKEHFRKYSMFTGCEEEKLMLKTKESTATYPLQRQDAHDGIPAINNAQNVLWSQDKQMFLRAYINADDMAKIMHDELYKTHVKRIVLTSPSGKIFMDSMEGNEKNKYGESFEYINEKNAKMFGKEHSKYERKSRVISGLTTIMVSKPFGEIKNSCRTLKTHDGNLSGGANDAGEYFYVMNVIFKRTMLNIQIFSVIIIGATLTALSIIAIRQFYASQQAELNHIESLKSQARQIHHDVSSPLMGLEWAIEKVLNNATNASLKDEAIDKHNAERATSIKHSISAIKDVVSSLYHMHDDESTDIEISPELLYPIISSAAHSARLLVAEDDNCIINLDKSKDCKMIANVNAASLRRVMINMIKNAIESIDENDGVKINISMKQDANNAVITIEDNGKGIPDNILTKISHNKPTTYNKVSGKGLGLTYAKRALRQFGGSIEISSKLNQGTTQKIIIPLSRENPTWFVDAINMKNIKKVIILDDSDSVHKILKDRITGEFFDEVEIVSAYGPQEFASLIEQIKAEGAGQMDKVDKAGKVDNANQNNQSSEILYLIDYSFGTICDNGIKVIKHHQISDSSILITSRYLESDIKKKCNELGIKLTAKEIISIIPFSY